MFTLTKPVKYLRRSLGTTLAATVAVAAFASGAPAGAAPAAPNSPGFNAYIVASLYRAALGNTVTITASTDHVMNGQNYFLRVKDETSGQILNQCDTGTTCTATVTLGMATTHVFSAHLDAGLGGPAPFPILSSATTSVLWKVPTVSMFNTAKKVTNGSIVASGTPVYFDAITDVPVTGSWYFISVRDTVSGELRRCSTGSLCIASQNYPNGGARSFVAHVDSRFPVNGLYKTVATSDVQSVSWLTSIHIDLPEEDAGDVSAYGAVLTASRDGSWSLTGTLYDGGWLFGDDYAYGFAWNGLGHGAEQAGNIAHDNHDPISIHGKDPWIAAHWSQVVVTPVTTHLSASSDLGDQLGDLWSFLEPYAGDALTWLLAS